MRLRVLPAIGWVYIGFGLAHFIHDDALIATHQLVAARLTEAGLPFGAGDILFGIFLIVVHWIAPFTLVRRIVLEDTRPTPETVSGGNTGEKIEERAPTGSEGEEQDG